MSKNAASQPLRFEDERLAWLADVILQSMKWADKESLLEMFSNEQRLTIIKSFFDVSTLEGSTTSTPFLCIYAVTGETFDTEGTIDEGAKKPRGAPQQPRARHQKLHITNQAVVPRPLTNTGSSGAAASVKLQTISCLCLVKFVGEPIAAADAVDWKKEPMCKLFTNIEVSCLEAPSLSSFNAMLTSLFLPLVEDVPVVVAGTGRGSSTTPSGGLDGTMNNSMISSGAGANNASSPTAAEAESLGGANGEEAPAAGRGAKGGLKGEVINWTKRVQTHVSGFISQVSAERSLPMPANPIPIGDSEADIKAAASNDDIVKDIDATVNVWHKEISEALAQEPKKEGPLGEIEYWKEKFGALSGLYDQVTRPEVKIILEVAREADCNAWHSMSGTMGLLNRQYAEAKDNVKFLSTLDRHFRAIHGVTADSAAGLQPILDTLQSMMMAIRMVWIISRYYNTEERMVSLLEKIAELIAVKVKQHIEPRTILSKPFADAKKKIREGHQVLTRWKTAYLNVQAEINASEREQHWMFDQKRLFEATDYMAERCDELVEIVNVIEYYHSTVLGPRLKAVLTDTTTLDQIEKKVDALKKPIEGNIDLFDKKSIHTWSMTYSTFNTNVQHLDQDVARFIQKIFDEELRSAESAFDLMLEFKRLQSRGGAGVGTGAPGTANAAGGAAAAGSTSFDINRMLLSKADKILHQFHSEIIRVENIFTTHQKNPPLTKNQPPIAGSIHWSTSLIMRLRKPYIRFRDEELFKGATGETVQRRCLEVVSMMRNYNTDRFEKWREDVRSTTSALLKKNILAIVKDTDIAAMNGEVMSPSASVVPGGNDVYVVNFTNHLFEIIKEAKYLDRLGFEIPPEALNVTLQDEAYHNYVDNLKVMLSQFNHELALVGAPEREILKSALKDLKAVLKPGLEDLNWISLGITDFIKKCNGQITEFRNQSREVRKHAASIQAVISKIGSTQLVKDLQITKDEDIAELQHVADEIDRERLEKLEPCLVGYHTIPQILRLIEDIVDTGKGTASKGATGKSELMAGYYAYWERKIWKALIKMTTNALQRFATLLGYHSKNNRKVRPPLFRIVVSLTTEPMYTPPQHEIQSTIEKIKSSIIDSTKKFNRWMRGTCLDVSHGNIQGRTQGVAGAAGAQDAGMDVLFTFFRDVYDAPPVKKLKKLIPLLQSNIAMLASHTKDLTNYYQIYMHEKQLSVDNIAKNEYHWSEYAVRFQMFMDMISSFDTDYHYIDFGFIRADETPFFLQLIVHVREWIRMEGKQLHEFIRQKRTIKLDQEITRYADGLKLDCQGIDDLKQVLQLMDDIRNRSLGMEIEYREVEFIYSTLLRYRWTKGGQQTAGSSVAGPTGFLVTAAAAVAAAAGPNAGPPNANSDAAILDDVNMAFNLRNRWQKVLGDIKTVDEQLAPKKVEFREQTKKEVAQFLIDARQSLADYRLTGPGRNEVTDLKAGVQLKNKWHDDVQAMNLKSRTLVRAEKLFGLTLTEYPDLITLNDEHDKVETVYALFESWNAHLSKWSSMMWVDVRIEDMQKVTDEKVKEAKILGLTHKNVQPYINVQQTILNFHASLPLLTKLKSPSLKTRHWKELMVVTQRQFNPDHITLDDFVAMDVYKLEDEINTIVTKAKKEGEVENQIQAIKDFWGATEFTMKKYPPKGNPRCSVITEVGDIQENVDDNILTMQGLANVKWVQPFITDVQIWEKRLSMINEVINVWVVVQVKWQYLESVFKGSEDIAIQLPKETNKFNEIDKRWIRIMDDTAHNPNVDFCCNQPDRLNDLKYINEKLDECQKDLSNYLETKRCQFPRFFFISDDDLLSILASSAAKSVQDHMLKMFDNSAALLFKGTSEIIEGVESAEKEQLMFDAPVTAEGQPVERWLDAVLVETRKTLRGILKAAVFYYPKMDRLEWVKKYHGMITLCGAKVWWTFQIEDAFAKVKKGKKAAVKDLSAKLSNQLLELVSEMDQNLSYEYRKKVNTLIIIDVHGRDIVDRFVRDSVLDMREFEWESQLRFYWDKVEDTCIIKQCTGTFRYGYEYMGLNGRLVITPLTDRCFMTLTQALNFYLGGAPGGPAGTGKTESVKDLAKAMALQCVVFNCGDGLDYKAMASIFSGLSQSGSWGCFDEFNRIELPVLSVVSEQLRCIQAALKADLKRFVFTDKEINLENTVGIFITMNPGYAGRVELPDNLKALFRPVVMVVPDMELIAENMLFSEGFKTARELAKKMVTLYSLARGQLSKQHHYDWGLRALKAVLVMAGQLKRGAPDLSEKAVLMRALRDMNAPKFVAEDEPLFKGLIGDLFPGMNPERVPQANLANASVKALKEDRMLADVSHPACAKLVDKVVQLYETMQTRHTSMVVGPTGGGKSIVIKTLCQAQEELKLPTKLFIINPKAQPTSALYGVLDPLSRNWTDGLFSNIFRTMNSKPTDREKRYVVFDGDVDARWVEDMNSVMDDNKLLTLPNGDRIRLQPWCALLFEVGDLQYASPATVSRVGMVYMDPTNLGWYPFSYSWLAKRNNREEAENIRELMERYLPQLLAFILEGIDEDQQTPIPRLTIPTTDLNMVKQLCMMLDTILAQKVVGPNGQMVSASAMASQDFKYLECIFIVSCLWGFGSLISSQADRERFDKFLKQLTGWPKQDSGADFSRAIGAGSLPERPTLYDYFFDLGDGKWKHWKERVKPFALTRPKDGKFSSILVSTVDTERGKWLLERIVLNRTPVLFVGDSGTAKTVTIQSYLRELRDRPKNADGEDDAIQLDEMLLELNFSNRTTSYDAQRSLEDNLEKRTNVVLGPPAKKRLLIFVDDVNMPKVDTYGTQQPIAFLKLLIEQEGWYDRKDLLFKKIKDIQFLAAMAPPGGGRNALDPRFVSLFTVFNIPFPSLDSQKTIFDQIVEDRFSFFSDDIKALSVKLTSATLTFYQYVVETLPATPAKFHYIFNLRDLSRVFEGLCRATPDMFLTDSSIIRLWRNEMSRVFMDRMNDETDRKMVGSKMEQLIRTEFPAHSETVLQDPLLFGDFGDYQPADSIPAGMEKPRLHLYQDFGADFNNVRGILDLLLEEINTPTVRLDLVMFDMAVEHLLRIVRVLSIPRGNLLLIGVGGSGKQSLTKLATFCCQMSMFEIILSRGYGEDAFREDLKKLYTRCGVDRQKVVFMFTDGHVKQEGFLELINNMLASGMVPALFPEEEKEPLYASVMDEITALQLLPTKDNKWNLFVNRCRDNLHVVLAMTPSGDTLRTRCRNFPSLINNTTIDYFDKWPAQALHAVATKVLAMEQLPDYLRDAITEHFVHVHISSDETARLFQHQVKRSNYVTPKNFLAFLANYAKLLFTKRQNIDVIVAKFTKGLERLHSAAEAVAIMSKELELKQIELSQSSAENEAFVERAKAMQKQTEEATKQANKTEEELTERTKQIEVESAEAAIILADAMPAELEAAAAIGRIDEKKIQELKTFANPSNHVVTVAKLICIFKAEGKDVKPSWEAGRGLMMQPGFLNSLKTFPKERLKEKTMREVRQLISEEKTDKDKIAGASQAAAELFGWVTAMQAWYEVFKRVAPLKEKVATLEQLKQTLEANLAETKATIERLTEESRQNSIALEEGLARARKLQAATNEMQRRLNAAKRLITGFTSERTRWTKEMNDLREARGRLVGDCIVGAAFMSYMGPFTYAYRCQIMEEKWLSDIAAKGITHTKPYKLEHIMTTDVIMSGWASDGLPADELSIQNGILTVHATNDTGEDSGEAKPHKKKTAAAAGSGDDAHNAKRKLGKIRYPLCIDPQMQAVRWIKKKYQNNPRFEVATFSDSDFLKRLENAIQYGNPFLFENVDEFIDPIIDSVLDPVFKEDIGGRTIRLGDKEITWDDNFRLYLCTKLSNPNYTAEIFGKAAVINYTVTQDGLESQLLNFVVEKDRSELQKQADELVQQVAENKKTLKELEDALISELELAEGNILDNEELIEKLEHTKSSASEVTKKLEIAMETSKEVEVSRQEYRPAARRGAILFFVVNQLSAINAMYEYSLKSFLHDVFEISILRSGVTTDTQKRLQNIIEHLTYNVYCYVCMGVFERHKLMYAFQMATRLLQGQGLMPNAELEFFLRGCVLAMKDFPPNPTNFLTERQWYDVCQLARTSPVFESLCQHIKDNIPAWNAWATSDKPEDVDWCVSNGTPWPNRYAEAATTTIPSTIVNDDGTPGAPTVLTNPNALTPIQRLCLLRCFRTDRVYIAVSYFIGQCDMMGAKFTVPPIVSYESVFKQSNCMSPIVCIVSPGANPTDEIVKLANSPKADGVKALKSISLGQGQGEEAMRMVEAGCVRGWWVLLQNCHLLISWMRELEKFLEKRDSNKPHPDFRLWLTTEPSSDFPLGILQKSLKVVNEPPNGLKMNIKNTLSKVAEEQLEACSHPAFRPLVYTLAFFHAVVQERRKYGKIGWNVSYDFNETDFTISMRLVDTYLEKANKNGDPLPWTTLRYLVGEAMYGGRVTDSFDRRIVTAYLEEYFGDFLFDSFQKFHFFVDPQVDYCLPPGSSDLTTKITRDAMTAHADQLKLDNTPEVFGLHANADTNYLRTASETMWANLIELMPRSSGGDAAAASGSSRESVLEKLTMEILRDIPEPFDRKQIMKAEKEKAKALKYDNLQPTQVVLLQELDRWNGLVNEMTRTLKDLQKALKGIIGMSSVLDDVASALHNGQLPAPWKRQAPATRKNLGRWLVHFKARYDQFKKWIEVAEPNVMWLAGLRIPESYISALVQITCRKYVWPLDKSTVFTRVTKFASPEEVKERPKDGAYVCGLFLEGAKWDSENMCLTAQDKKILYYELPVLEIIPQETSKLKLVGTFRTPVYVTRDRRDAGGTGLVFEADIGSQQHASHWILESVALFLNSDD